MSQENVEITRRFVEDFNLRGVDALVDFYDPEVAQRSPTSNWHAREASSRRSMNGRAA